MGHQAEKWEEGFRQLQRYANETGHARVPRSYAVGDYPLGGWVMAQRDVKRKGTLDADRQQRFENLPGWAWEPHTDRWQEGFRQIQRYVDETGNARVPFRYTVNGFPLGGWVITQRSSYAKGQLDADRQHRLEALPGWTWDTNADRWEEGFRRLQCYVDNTGHARVPTFYSVDDYRLGEWVHTQRQAQATGTLSADRRHRLQELPSWTWKAR